MPESSPLKILLNTLPQQGRIEWIGVRPARNVPMNSLEQVQIHSNKGLEGDRFSGGVGNPRQVTLIQQEHLAVIASCLGKKQVDAATLRRNLVVSGINLLALKDKRFRVGEALLEYSGLCHPCSKMEKALGPGGYNAMRGHGGITASVIEGGPARLQDSIVYQPRKC